MRAQNPGPTLVGDLSDDAITHLLSLGFSPTDEAAPIVVQVYGDMLREIGDAKTLAQMIGVRPTSISLWSKMYGIPRPVLTAIGATIGERFEPRRPRMASEDREMIAAWVSGVPPDIIAGVFGYANAGSVKSMLSKMRKIYGPEAVPYLYWHPHDEAWNQAVISKWNSGLSAVEATEITNTRFANSIIKLLRNKYGPKTVLVRQVHRTARGKQEISDRWRAGQTATEATGIADSERAHKLIGKLRWEYGVDAFPYAKRGTGIAGSAVPYAERDALIIEAWRAGMSAKEATGIDDSDNAGTMIAHLRKKYGENIVPYRTVPVLEQESLALMEEQARKYREGASASEATGLPMQQATGRITYIRSKLGEEKVPIRATRTQLSDEEIIKRWRAGYDVEDATGLVGMNNARQKITHLRKRYGVQAVPKRLGSKSGGWYWK